MPSCIVIMSSRPASSSVTGSNWMLFDINVAVILTPKSTLSLWKDISAGRRQKTGKIIQCLFLFPRKTVNETSALAKDPEY